MSLTFPNSPSTNDTHTTGGSSWIFDGEKWVRQGTTGPQGTQGLQGVQGLQGLSNQGVQGLQGLMGIQGRQGVQGTDGADGNFGGATFDYTFSTSTANGDPGTGKLRLNNSTVSSATALYIDVEDDNGTDISSFLTTIDDSTSTIKGHFRISNRLNADDFALFTISSASSQQGAYYSVSCGYVSGSASSFSNNEDVIITFARTGDKGDTGATGSQGVQGLQGLKGSQGVQGLSNQGVQGLQGILGTAGSAGAAGAQGTTGTAGSNGSNGSNGAQGTAGTAAGGGVGVDYDDNIKVRFGDDNDMEQFFDGTRFSIQPKTTSTTSQLDFEAKDQVYIHSIDNGVFLRSKNQSVIDLYGGYGGGIYFKNNGTQYLKLEYGNWTTQNNADWNFIGTNYDIRFDASDGALEFEDSASAKFGTGDDLQIYHNGNASYISNYNGTLFIDQEADNGTLALRSDNGSGSYIEYIECVGSSGEVRLHHYGNQKLATKSNGIDVTGHTETDTLRVSGIATFQSTVNLGQSDKLLFNGTSGLEIYENGTTGVIQANNTNGRMTLEVNNGGGGASAELIQLRGTGNLISANFKPNSGVQLYGRTGSNSAAVRLETNSTGVDVTGDLTITDTATDSSAGPELLLYRNSSSPDDGDYLGQIKFQGESDTGATRNYAKITGKIGDASNGTEDGILEFAFLKAGSQNINARWTSTELKLLNGTYLSLEGDNQELRLGASDDLQLWHNGTASFISNITGNLNIRTTSSAGDINLTSNDNVSINVQGGSETAATFTQNGSVDLYYDNSKKFETTSGGATVTGTLTATTFSGSGASLTGVDAATLDSVDSTSFLRSDAADTKTSGDLTFNDSVKASFGTDGDLKISSNNIHSYISNYSGQLMIEQEVENGYINIRNDNGSGSQTDYIVAHGGSGEVRLYHYGSQKLATKSGGVTVTGTVTATSFSGDGSSLTGITGTTINNNANNRIITGSGTANTLEGEANLTFDGTALAFANVTGPSGSDSRIFAYTEGGATTGTLVLEGKQDLRFKTGGFNRWILDGGDLVTHGTTYNNLGAASASGGRVGNGYFQTSVDLIDDGELRLGTGDDLKLYHDGTNSYIENATGNLLTRVPGGNLFAIQKSGGTENIAIFNADGAVELYHNNSQKFITQSNGVRIYGGIKDKDGDLGTSGQVLSSTGTALNWVDADSGPQGVQGLKGATGSNGSSGSNGAQGIAGSDGTNGSNGSNGAQGTQGSAGSNGSNGSNGAQGTAGTQGATGPDGGNAGTLDNLDSTAFLRSNTSDTATGMLTLNGGLTFGGSQVLVHNETATRDKIRVWSSNNYAIGMDNAMSFGGLNDYATTFQMNNDGDRGWVFLDTAHSDAQGAMSLTTNGKMCIAHSLRLGYGESDTTTPGASYRLDVSGNIYSSGTVTAASDITLKKNITTIDNALDKVCNLRGVEFDYIESGEHNIGVIAQEVEKVLPELVHTDSTKSVAYGNLTAVLIEAVKELKKENDALSARIKSLEDR